MKYKVKIVATQFFCKMEVRWCGWARYW